MKQDRFNKAMKKQKAAVEKHIAAASEERGIVLLFTGDGKGKTTAAFGIIMRAIAYRQKIGVVQFIKGTQLSGEEMLLRDRFPEVDFHQMGTGFTWDTQNHAADAEAARQTWAVAEAMLRSAAYTLVVLDELTYMLGFKFLDEAVVLEAIRNRPARQHVVITGRGGGSGLRDIADTVSEVRNIRHAYDAGIKAQPGIDY